MQPLAQTGRLEGPVCTRDFSNAQAKLLSPNGVINNHTLISLQGDRYRPLEIGGVVVSRTATGQIVVDGTHIVVGRRQGRSGRRRGLVQGKAQGLYRRHIARQVGLPNLHAVRSADVRRLIGRTPRPVLDWIASIDRPQTVLDQGTCFSIGRHLKCAGVGQSGRTGSDQLCVGRRRKRVEPERRSASVCACIARSIRLHRTDRDRAVPQELHVFSRQGNRDQLVCPLSGNHLGDRATPHTGERDRNLGAEFAFHSQGTAQSARQRCAAIGHTRPKREHDLPGGRAIHRERQGAQGHIAGRIGDPECQVVSPVLGIGVRGGSHDLHRTRTKARTDKRATALPIHFQGATGFSGKFDRRRSLAGQTVALEAGVTACDQGQWRQRRCDRINGDGFGHRCAVIAHRIADHHADLACTLTQSSDILPAQGIGPVARSIGQHRPGRSGRPGQPDPYTRPRLGRTRQSQIPRRDFIGIDPVVAGHIVDRGEGGSLGIHPDFDSVSQARIAGHIGRTDRETVLALGQGRRCKRPVGAAQRGATQQGVSIQYLDRNNGVAVAHHAG